MTDPIEYLDVDDLVDLARTLLGDPPPICDIGLLGSTAARPKTAAFGEGAYPDLPTKAAALLQSIVNNHALVDGNNRLGWLGAAVFLDLNGIKASRASTTRSTNSSSGSPRPILTSTKSPHEFELSFLAVGASLTTECSVCNGSSACTRRKPRRQLVLRCGSMSSRSRCADPSLRR